MNVLFIKDKSIDVKFEQLKNILWISDKSGMIKFDKSIEFKAIKFEKKFANDRIPLKFT
jgi:hypothetical protein